MTAAVVEALPEGDRWLYELKLDGYRAQIIKAGDRVALKSRNEKDLTRAYPGVAAAAQRIKADSAVVDGEVVAVDEAGRPSFQALQHPSGHTSHTVVFYAFDLLHLDGQDLTQQPLTKRRDRLPDVLKGSGLLLSVELPGTAAEVTAAIRRLGLEGVIAKRRDSTYDARSKAWVKLKLDKQQEFVVGGYRPGPHGIDALLVGYYENRALRFAAKVRAGFTPRVRRDVFDVVKAHHTAKCPFADLPNHTKKSRWGEGITPEDMATFQWLKPVVVAQVRFVEWTADGHLRHAAFLGLRLDKPARVVVRE